MTVRTGGSSPRRASLAAALIGVWLLGASLVSGARGAAGAGVGVLMVVLFFTGGRAPMSLARFVAAGPLFLLIALGYVVRVVLLLAVFSAVSDAGWLDRGAVASTIIVGALAWCGASVAAHLTSRQPVLELPALDERVAR